MRKRTRQLALERLDVDVAGAILHRLEEQRVHEPDDRRLVVGVEEVARLLELVRDQVEALLLEVRPSGPRRCRSARSYARLMRVEDRRGRHDDRTRSAAVEHAQVVERRRGRAGRRPRPRSRRSSRRSGSTRFRRANCIGRVASSSAIDVARAIRSTNGELVLRGARAGLGFGTERRREKRRTCVPE